jgi:hypothetical protein
VEHIWTQLPKDAKAVQMEPRLVQAQQQLSTVNLGTKSHPTRYTAHHVPLTASLVLYLILYAHHVPVGTT